MRRVLAGGATRVLAGALPWLLLGSAVSTADTRIGQLWDGDPRVLYAVDTDQPVVALTLDDGPDPRTTPALLALLERYHAKATFFVIAERAASQPELVADIVAAGHELGNHMTRDEPSIDLPPDQFERELLEADRILSRYAPVHWFRPGSGWYDDWMLDIVARHDYRTVLGTVYPLDAHLPWPWFAERFVLWRAQPGAIIILHDHGKRGARTLRTLSAVLPELRRRGLRVVTVSELIAAAVAPDRGTDVESPPDRQ